MCVYVHVCVCGGREAPGGSQPTSACQPGSAAGLSGVGVQAYGTLCLHTVYACILAGSFCASVMLI